MKMLKIIGIIGLVIVVLGVAAWLAFRWLTEQPLYRPGMVRDGKNLSAPLTPPLPQGTTAQSGTWQMEEGMELYWFSEGSGRPVLFIHGGPGIPSRTPLSGLAPLTDEYRFFYYDARGCGDSTRPFDRFSSPNSWENMSSLDRTLGLGAQIADIERIRQILGEDKLILVGHSFGSFIASLYAAEFPEHVEALVLSSPANVLVMPSPEADSDLFASVRAALPPEEQAAFDAFMADYMDFGGLFQKSETDLIAMNNEFGEWYGKVIPLDELPSQEEQAEPAGWATWAVYVSMGQKHDYRPALREVTAPVLVLHGGGDLQSEAASALYVQAFPNAQLAVIEGASHFSYEEQPQAFADAVGTFLEGMGDKE